MTKIKKNVIFFSSGGVGYGIIELIWRGRTHWTMIIAGGACFVIFSLIADKCKKRTLIFKSALCALSVTAIELLFGLLFNMLLKMNVWDYSGMPFNLLGQICLEYTLLWGLLGAAAIKIIGLLERNLFKGPEVN